MINVWKRPLWLIASVILLLVLAPIAKTGLAAETPAQIAVTFLLDPRLTGNTYMGERWVSPPVYDIVSTGLSYALPTKVEGRDANGLPVAISPDWIPADPAMVTVSPTLGSAVTITVQSPGETSLQIASEGISKTLLIKAVYWGSTCSVVRVAFSQTGVMPNLVQPDCPPLVVDAGGPYYVEEGASTVLSATSSAPEGKAVSFTWDLDDNGSFESPGQSVTFSAVGLEGPRSHTVAVEATDGVTLSAAAETSVYVLNVAPTVATGVLTSTVSAPGTSVTLTTSFADPGGVADAPYQVTIAWQDGVTDTISADAPGAIEGSHSYVSAGVYGVEVTVTDKDGDSGSSCCLTLSVQAPDPSPDPSPEPSPAPPAETPNDQPAIFLPSLQR